MYVSHHQHAQEVKGEVTTILLTLHENRTIQNKLTMRSVPDPPVHAGDEKHTSSAARWVWVQDLGAWGGGEIFFSPLLGVQNVNSAYNIIMYIGSIATCCHVTAYLEGKIITC